MGSTSGFAPEPGVLEQRVSRRTGIRAGRVPIRGRSPTGRSGTAISLPHGLQAWLRLSNGLFGGGPFIHPITAIGPMIPFARVPEHDRPARELVRAGQSQPADDLHRPGLSLAGRQLSDLHLRRRRDRAVRRGSSPGASRSGFSSCCGKRGGNTGSTLASGILATRGSRTAGTSRSRRCRRGCGRTPTALPGCTRAGPTSGRSPRAWAWAVPTSSRSSVIFSTRPPIVFLRGPRGHDREPFRCTRRLRTLG